MEFVLLDQRHPCLRPCLKGVPPMICRYNFTVEWYQTMSKACYNCPHEINDCYRPHCISADGNKRPVLVINRQMPGPKIEVNFFHIYINLFYIIVLLRYVWEIK